MRNYGGGDVRCVRGDCAYTNDGQCDEPEGTGACADGSDVADCGTGTCWEAYRPDYPKCVPRVLVATRCIIALS